ncbi:unnamed protein product [Chironomus riparius]|uniref:HMG box domain-containing protein n=1 Tax=Chironomus riparius TaxID=315576 RepID=A0A9N9WSM1_9DIPT|nr:unnamed protein product [Chironomus riparius]
MDTSYNIGNEMDANMFNQYMYKRPDENLDVSLSVPQYNGHPPPPPHGHIRYHNLNDQTQFHTPSFGDEEFDIPPGVMHPHHHHQQPHHPSHHQLDQYQMHSQMGGLMNDQYSQHQWHQHPQASPAQGPESHMMSGNQTYHNLHSPTNHSTYHHLSSPNQQMLMMQPPQQTHQQPPPNQHQQQQQQQIQPQMSPQMSGGNNYIGQSPPQTAPINSHENGSTSDDSDENNTLNDPNANTFKRPSPDPYIGNDSPNRNNSTMKAKAAPARKPKTSKKKKKKDPNEPQKPVSAYALFFRDTQASIKGQNPNASFGEVSKIVASMWDVLAPDHKNVYKKRTEVAKKEYLKALAAYRASLVSQGTESESQSPPHQQLQQKNVTVSTQNTHKIQNQPPPPSSQHMQQSMPPNGPHRMSPGQHHQMPPQSYVPQPMHNYQPAPHPYSHTPSPYGSPQQPLLYPMNPNMMQPPPLNGMNGMMNMQQQQQQQQQPGPQQYINQQGYIDQQQQQQQPASQQQSEMLVFS